MQILCRNKCPFVPPKKLQHKNIFTLFINILYSHFRFEEPSQSSMFVVKNHMMIQFRCIYATLPSFPDEIHGQGQGQGDDA
jgi:hypothetical protein